MIQYSKPFAIPSQQKDAHAEIEQVIQKIPKVLEENDFMKIWIWSSVLKNAQPALRQCLSQNKCQLLDFNGLEAVISIPEGYRSQEEEKSRLIEAVFQKVGHHVEVRFRYL